MATVEDMARELVADHPFVDEPADALAGGPREQAYATMVAHAYLADRARTAALVGAARKVSAAVFSSNANDWIAAVDELNAALQPFERAAGEGEQQ